MNDDIRTKKWNDSISPRITALRAWFKAPEWTEGLRPYLLFLLESDRDQLERPGTSEHDQFIKGKVSAFKEIINLPLFIEKQIEMQEKPAPKPSGDAGY
jgi:hypothetical protein